VQTFTPPVARLTSPERARRECGVGLLRRGRGAARVVVVRPRRRKLGTREGKCIVDVVSEVMERMGRGWGGQSWDRLCVLLYK